MARIVYSMLTSLDGYIEGPDGNIGLPVPEGKLHRHFNDEMRRTSTVLCGRRMYDAMRFGTESLPQGVTLLRYAPINLAPAKGSGYK
ncbi:MAG: hypothetical protein EOS65_14080 [Mesorhizobium sp.]|uniref:dihydrofolate reductase family protein n=1 Tax=Mesorhizobium sp. TaxID=1871066 RepID=UPI000FD60393|nr:hypothetical protein [Mesorhizobium sp.]RVC63565.1 hypothetical protein EN779_04525 [Mesorhizobium sp. M4B.F.Ca.ET.088.02.2.1]RWF31134.1 MAG: hypothetical protein EOS45_11955 [Mesorhizobium sp.]RWF40974.1 MAG: hypothetical protein EOS65_14080 [Mesorhizobium sp.]TIX14646.1 MAG: hypothetical protein E5V41_18125 [Mesorhizobium sp.]TJW05881.1 MAG: hypothetical protein E5W97_08615 [Mesorhizobium sp.]